MCQYTFAGVRERIPLGACSAISITAAREARRAILGDVAQGRDPAAERKAEAAKVKQEAEEASFTFGALIDQWESLGLANRRASYAAEAVRRIALCLRQGSFGASVGPRPDGGCARPRRARQEGQGGYGDRTAAYGRAAYSWALKRGAIDINPFQSLPVATVASRDRVLTDDELRVIWQATEVQGVFNSIVRTLLLTGQRREEVAGMAWSEISDDGSVWIIPASRAKNGVAHLVPLSMQARAVIEKMPRMRQQKTPEGVQEVKNAFVFQSQVRAVQRLQQIQGRSRQGQWRRGLAAA